jgi:hypothetical protein
MPEIYRIHHPYVPRLGRIYVPHEGNAAYGLRSITREEAPERTVPWGIGQFRNQGDYPKCVAFTIREWLDAEPNLDPDHDSPDTDTLYALAQRFDGIPGPHDGSNSNGAMKGLQTLGLVDSYHWAQAVDEAIHYLRTTGPLCVGSNWRQGMFTPDSNGFIQAVGPVEGGHEYLCYWFDTAEDAFWCQQSWGVEWNPAFPGRFKIKRADVDKLWGEGMDFCAALVHFPRPVLAPVPKHKPRRRWYQDWPWVGKAA